MNADIDTAIKSLLARITDKITADEALRFTQAALNLAHAESTLECTKRENSKQGGGGQLD